MGGECECALEIAKFKHRMLPAMEAPDPIMKWMKIFMIKERRRQDNSTPVLVASQEVGLAEEYGGLNVGVFAVSTGARSA